MGRRRPRWVRFPVWALVALVALVALGMKAPGWWCQAAHYWKRKPVLDALERPITVHSPRAEGIEGALRRISEASVSRGLPKGLRIFVDNEGLGEDGLSGLTLEEPLPEDLDAKRVPAKDVLVRLLGSRGMKYVLSEPSADLTVTNQGSTDLVIDSINCYVERYLISKD